MNMSQVTLRTNFQIEREARDLAIYNEYQELISVAGASACKVNEHLMNKYGLHSQGSIYVIRKRVEDKLKKEAAL